MGKHLASARQRRQQPPIWRTNIALSAVLMLAVLVATGIGLRWLVSAQSSAGPQASIPVNSQHQPTTDLDLPASAPNDVVIVHVAGAVQRPGIVELRVDDRVVDAIEGAGGPTTDAVLDALNLAAIVRDGEYILVPDQDTPAGTGPPSVVGASPANQPVNLNTADAAALETLPGIGPATAAQIIAHRDQHGPFSQLSDIEAVSGIGPATRARLEGLVTW